MNLNSHDGTPGHWREARIQGGIYSGVFAVTKAAAVAVVYIIIMDRLVYRRIKLKDIPEVFYQSGKTIGVIGTMIAMSAVFA